MRGLCSKGQRGPTGCHTSIPPSPKSFACQKRKRPHWVKTPCVPTWSPGWGHAHPLRSWILRAGGQEVAPPEAESPGVGPETPCGNAELKEEKLRGARMTSVILYFLNI